MVIPEIYAKEATVLRKITTCNNVSERPNTEQNEAASGAVCAGCSGHGEQSGEWFGQNSTNGLVELGEVQMQHRLY